MNKFLEINNWGLFISVFSMFIVMLISSFNRLKLNKDILIGTVRSFIQLFIMGFILRWSFKHSTWYLTVLLFLVMLLTAAHEAYKRLKIKSKKLYLFILLSLAIGTIIPLSIMFYLIIRIKPWYNIQFIIPISGMIVANSMTALALGLNNYLKEVKMNKNLIETKLSLGAGVKCSIDTIFKSSYYNGLLPSINALMVLGIAKLPGMMTGQIIAGASPLEAVKYQLMIMYMISFSTAISLFILLKAVQKIIFNKRDQLFDLESK